MMPFSVLRMWFFGLTGWLVLGFGVYLLYEWSRVRSVPEAVTLDVRDLQAEGAGDPRERTVIVQRDRPSSSLPLWGGLLLVLFGSGVPRMVWRLLSGGFGRRSDRVPASRTQRLLRPDGSELHIEHVGPETAPVLLLTHGWSLDQSDWDGVRAALGDRYHLVLWDLAGLGRSTAPQNGDHSLEKMAADLEAVLMQATEGPVILVGHSIGGMIQQVFCRMFPSHLEQRVRGIVFVHTTYTNPAKTALGSPLLIALQKPVLEPLTYLTIWLAPLMWLSNWQSYWNGSLHLSTRLSSFAGQQTWQQIDAASRLQARAWPAVVGRGMLAMTRFDEQQTLPQISVPTLIIAGWNDRLTKREASQVLAQRLPHASLITLEPAGHYGLWEQHAGFESALATFADSLTQKVQSPSGTVTVP